MTKSHFPAERAGETKTDQHGAARAGDRARTRPTARSSGTRGTVLRAVPSWRSPVVAVRPGVTGHGRVPSG